MTKPRASEIAAKVKPGPNFIDDFFLVATHYGCTQEEIAQMRQCARDNLPDAQRCFAALAAEIRPQSNVTESIRARIEAEKGQARSV